MKKTIKRIIALGVGATLIGGALVGCADVSMTQGQYNDAVKTAFNEGKSSVNIKSDNAEVRQAGYDSGVASVDITTDNAQAGLDATTEKDAEITRLNAVIKDTKKITGQVDEEDETEGYNLDELEIGAEFNLTVSDRQLSGLFDDEITFNDDEYDVEEVVYLTDLKVANNYEDEYEADTYLQIPQNGVRYGVEFDSELNISEITKDETLEFNFLGEKVELSDWSIDKVSFTKGTEVTLREGAETEVDGKTITLSFVADGYVSVDVDGASKKIYEDKTEKVNGIEVRVTEVVETTSWRKGMATLEVGDDVSFEVEDGDEYEANDLWEWAIDGNSIGLVLTEAFMSVDEDEEYKALAVGETLWLPNNYVGVTFEGLVDEDTEKYTFEFDMKDGEQYVEVKGVFLDGIEDYDKLYVNSSGFYDKDLDLVDATSVEFANAEIGNNVPLTLDIVGTNLVFDNVVLGLNLSSITVDGDSIETKEEDYLTSFGIVIKTPEDSVEDNEFKVVIPDEELEASVTVRYKQ